MVRGLVVRGVVVAVGRLGLVFLFFVGLGLDGRFGLGLLVVLQRVVAGLRVINLGAVALQLWARGRERRRNAWARDT